MQGPIGAGGVLRARRRPHALAGPSACGDDGGMGVNVVMVGCGAFARWRRYAGLPPMYDPTHAIGAIPGVTDARLTHVSCQGQVDRHADGLFRADANIRGNTFSNESALFRASDQSLIRINEFRRIGCPGHESMSMWGTERIPRCPSPLFHVC